MTTSPSNMTQTELDMLLRQLRQKEGAWVDWGEACQTLQKAGLSPQAIFEGTGFEPVQQNQVIVAAQVYRSLLTEGVSEAVRSHFQQRGSDCLYELRVLSQADRARAAELIWQQGLDADQVREVAKALKEFAYRTEPPPGFSDQPGDAVAYHYWRLARQQSDLQKRSHLIAQGLRFVHSSSARQAIEQLLTDFTVVKTKAAPRLPLFRLEDESDLPCLVPVAGEWPLPTADFTAVPVAVPEEPFGIVRFAGTGAWAPLPGWQVVLQAEDPVALLASFPALPNAPQDAPADPVLILVDRAQRQWDESRYFVCDAAGELAIQWFDTAPTQPLLGQILVIIRPKRILDEDYTRELWQIDE